MNYHTKVWRENNWWLAQVVEEPHLHTEARTLARLRENLVDAIGMWLDVEYLETHDPEALVPPTGRHHVEIGQHIDRAAIDIEWDIQLPSAVRRSVQDAQRKRERAAALQTEATEATQAAVDSLRAAGFSHRDAAVLLGLSHQRVAQIAS
jgi:predicted RNase H-like HicB family nuclease